MELKSSSRIISEEAVQAVYDLENRGLPFNRTPDGRIDQRRFGGHTRNFGEAPVRRACYAADRTGHMILQTLYQQCIKNQVTFFDEFQVVDVVMDGRKCGGVVSVELATGDIHIFKAKAVHVLRELREEYKKVRVQDRSKAFNTDLLEILELGNLLDLGPFNVKEQILDSGKGEEPCRAFGKAFGEKVGG
ncbi:MAG: succinate dehydrogenase / fumarate reductase, flavoprotein subunit [Desulfobacteraceae bacterium Eth-SRB2]|nr:MAG: succinate dehydrogenase / fumarate reductase, flavoprotein subunit [Desulfobacteraceae bacterium Eth-SRB2]